jgi:hypothetical protein
MSNPTTPFNWQMPTNTNLVTDLPADFEVFGQAVATSMADLLGGTTGQILAKATNADMDFTWIANDQGDITSVTATSPLTGGGTSGAITVGIQASSTTQSGAVQLSDSTSTTSSVLAATPTAVKSAYDLAAAAVPKSTVTTAGDVIYATGSGAVTRLGIGTAGQVLTVNGGATAPSWATASSSNQILQVVQATTGTSVSNSTSTYADTTLTATITPTSASSKILVFVSHAGIRRTLNTNAMDMRLLRAGSQILEFVNYAGSIGSTAENYGWTANTTYLDAPATTSATIYKTQFRSVTNQPAVACQSNGGTSVIILMEISGI